MIILFLDEVTSISATTTADHPAIKRLKASSETRTTSGDPSGIVEKTPLISGVKRPDIEVIGPSSSLPFVGTPSVAVTKGADMNEVMRTEEEDKRTEEQDKVNAEDEEFTGFQTPRMEKSKLQSARSSLTADASISEGKRPDFLSSEKKRVSIKTIYYESE